MSTTDVGLVNAALARIGAAPIAALDDPGHEATTAGLLFGPTYEAVLAAYPWRHATRHAAMAPPSGPGEGGFAHAFALPADCLRVLALTPVGSDLALRYRLAGGSAHCDLAEPELRYVARVAVETTPAHVADALVARLAAEFAIPITESTSRAESLARRADDLLARARLIDGQQDTPGGIAHFPLIEVRGR
ncbi:MAG: hypothetical protein RLO50_01510 [Azospirillaceae bacterium]